MNCSGVLLKSSKYGQLWLCWIGNWSIPMFVFDILSTKYMHNHVYMVIGMPTKLIYHINFVGARKWNVGANTVDLQEWHQTGWNDTQNGHDMHKSMLHSDKVKWHAWASLFDEVSFLSASFPLSSSNPFPSI